MSTATSSPLLTPFLDGFRQAAATLQTRYDRHALRALWQNSRSWTDIMLGTKSGAGYAGVVRAALESVGKSLTRTDSASASEQPEWFKIDRALVSADTIWGDDTKVHFYPRRLYVLVEHENAQHWDTELWKLIHLRAPLKVLIGYETSGYSIWLKDVPQKIKQVADWQGTQAFSAHGPETYLFVSGAWDASQSTVRWDFQMAIAPTWQLVDV